jgi:uncharacterized protein YfiM (DUF2279 family)
MQGVIRQGPFRPWHFHVQVTLLGCYCAHARDTTLSMFRRVRSASKPETESVPLATAAADGELLQAHHPAALAVALAAGNAGHVSAAVRAAMHGSQVTRHSSSLVAGNFKGCSDSVSTNSAWSCSCISFGAGRAGSQRWRAHRPSVAGLG